MPVWLAFTMIGFTFAYATVQSWGKPNTFQQDVDWWENKQEPCYWCGKTECDENCAF